MRFRIAFGLRTMFVLVTIAAACIACGLEGLTVYKRRVLAKSIQERGGNVVMVSANKSSYPEPQPLSMLRRWLGDTPALVNY